MMTVMSSSNLLKLIIPDQFYTWTPFDGRNSILSTAIAALDPILTIDID